MKLTFHGAARQVTGSMFLLELEDGYKVLIDCGIDFSNRQEEQGFPFYPSQIDVVLLTHAHLDHCGNIPKLFQSGYQGQVLCTPPTYALTQLILDDAAAIRSKNIKRKLRRKKFGGRKVSEEAELQNHVKEAAEKFVTVSFDQEFEIREDLKVTFKTAGHLLGAANIVLEVKEGEKWKKIAFSGDIGRDDYPLLQNPAEVPEVDYLVCETTYGSRKHIDSNDPEGFLYNVIRKTCVEQPGRLVIPSFSVGRTQALLYILNKLYSKQKLPPIKIFADSPMARSCTEIYEANRKFLNQEANEFYREQDSLFDFENLVIIRGHKESKAINNHQEPCIILSSSGMIAGGRIQEHVKKNLGNYYCTILQVGFCAEGTTGNSLFNGQKVINVKGRNIPVLANIVSTDIFSGHGDQEDLLRFVDYQDTEKLKNIFLVHGEEESMECFKDILEEKGYKGIELPEKGQTYTL